MAQLIQRQHGTVTVVLAVVASAVSIRSHLTRRRYQLARRVDSRTAVACQMYRLMPIPKRVWRCTKPALEEPKIYKDGILPVAPVPLHLPGQPLWLSPIKWQVIHW